MRRCALSPDTLLSVLLVSKNAVTPRVFRGYCHSRQGGEEKVLTYAQFVLSAIWLAEQLGCKPLSVFKGTKVAILVEKSVDWLTAILACNLIGAPFTLFDTRNKLEQRKHVWRTWRPTVVICR